jgi:hypothetical protein
MRPGNLYLLTLVYIAFIVTIIMLLVAKEYGWIDKIL